MWRIARPTLALSVVAILAWRLGAGPFLDGLRLVDARILTIALVVGAGTTLCAAHRWRLVATGLGTRIDLPAAIAASYRAQFLNAALPGGVLGDVHRGLRLGHEDGHRARGLRAVAWDRALGQGVQVALTVAAVAVLPDPFGLRGPTIALLVTVVVVAACLATRRLRTILLTDLRSLATGRRGIGIVVASTAAVAGYVTMFLAAAWAAGVQASVELLVPIALLVLVAMAVPVNVAGWGPREGVAVWAFAHAGLDASTGLTVAVVYGVMSIVATLPGVVVLAADSSPRRPTVQGARHG